MSVATGSIVALSVFLVSIAMAGALAYDGPFWASASRAVPWRCRGAMGLIHAESTWRTRRSTVGESQAASAGSCHGGVLAVAGARRPIMITLRRQADSARRTARGRARCASVLAIARPDTMDGPGGW